MRVLSRLAHVEGEALAPAQALVASPAPMPPSSTRFLPTLLPGAIPGTTQLVLLVRHRLQRLSFMVVVLLPVTLAVAYYFGVAADQYVAEFRFALNTAEAPRLDPLSLLAGGASHSPAAFESQILVQYMVSRAIVDQLDRSIDLRRLFAPPEADWWARLPRNAAIEDLVQYWKGQVDAFFDPANGTVTVKVRAFTPADALRLSEAIVAANEKLVNDLSLRARRDALQQSESEVAQAEARLQSVLGDIRAFREREGMIDPSKTAEATGMLTTRLRDELVRANADLSTLRAYMRDDAPSIKVLKARIKSLEAQKRSLAHEATGSGTPDKPQDGALTRALGSYERLENERKFAENAYQHSLQSLDRARADADRQRVFVASYIPPSLPEEPLYPRRWRSIGTIALLAFALWGIGSLSLQSIRDHLS